MKMKKFMAVAAGVLMVGALAMFGCSGGNDAKANENANANQPAADENANVPDEDTIELLTDGVLTVATSPDYPPFENLEGDEYVGFDIALAEAIAEELGLNVEFKSLQFDGIITAIAAGGQADIGISGFSVDPERAKTVDFTDAYYVDNLAIATMKDNTAITADNAATALDSAEVVIAVQSGTTGETYIQENFPNATLQAYGNSNDCFAAMQAGQATAVCTNLAVVEQMLSVSYTDAQIVLSIATGEDYAIVVSQDNPALTKAINEVIAKLEANGTIERLQQEYLG